MVKRVLRRMQECDGDVPYLRGKIHYLVLCFYPLLVKTLRNGQIQRDVRTGVLIFLLCYLFNMWTTTLLHNNQRYIYRSAFKRLDYASIFLIVTVNALPMGLLFSPGDRLVAAALIFQWLLTFAGRRGLGAGVFWALVFDYGCLSKEYRSIIHAAVSIPSVAILFRIAEGGHRWALAAIFAAWAWQFLGVFMFVTEWPLLLPGVLGHHELFHVCSIICFGHIVFANHLVLTAEALGALG